MLILEVDIPWLSPHTLEIRPQLTKSTQPLGALHLLWEVDVSPQFWNLPSGGGRWCQADSDWVPVFLSTVTLASIVPPAPIQWDAVEARTQYVCSMHVLHPSYRLLSHSINLVGNRDQGNLDNLCIAKLYSAAMNKTQTCVTLSSDSSERDKHTWIHSVMDLVGSFLWLHLGNLLNKE